MTGENNTGRTTVRVGGMSQFSAYGRVCVARLQIAFFGLWSFAIISVCSAATLDLRVNVVAGADESVDEEVVENAYFVFDRSGSMKGPSEIDYSKSRYEELLRMFNETLESLPRSTRVYYLAFSSAVDPINGGPDGCGFPVRTPEQRMSLFEQVKKDAKSDGGITLLYDAQDAIMTQIRKDKERLSSANKRLLATLYVYTDGLNETDQSPTAQYISNRSVWSKDRRGNPRRAGENRNYMQDCTNACEKLMGKFPEFYEQKKDYITVERIFLADTKGLPDAERWRKKVVFQPVIDGDFSKLENPLAQDKQVVSSTLRFPMPDKRWDELEGKSALLCLKYGNIKRSVPLVIRKGAATACFDLSGITGANATVAELTLEKLPNDFTDFELKSPNPVFLTFPKTGTVMLSVEEPGLQSVKRINEPIKFSAKCTEGASLTWTFSDKEIRQGTSFVRSFNTATNYRFIVKADKEPLDASVLTGIVQVVEAGVVIKQPSDSIVVEKEVQFLADAKGAVRGYDWYVNGTPVSGDGKTLRYTFPKSGEYKVQVQARYQNVLPAISPEVVVNVKTAPRISIRSPMAYSEDCIANEEIRLKAELEGGFDKVIWEIKGAETVTKESGVVHEEGSGALKISTALVKIVKPGDYQILAKAVGADGEKLSLPVLITVKRADVSVNIDSPIEGHRLRNGIEEHFVANVKGKEIAKVHWYAEDEEGNFIDIGVVDVANGLAKLVHAFPLDAGNRSLRVFASGLDADGKEFAEPFLSKPRRISSFVSGGVVIDMKDNLARVPYGEQRPLSVKKDGAVTNVLWFMVEDGKESPIPANGDVIQSPVVKADGKTPERMVDYFARGSLPGGGEVKSQVVTLIHYCPPVSARIVLPMTNGVTITSIGKGVEYEVDLKDVNGNELLDVENVIWEMGDGVAYTNRGNSVTHRYANYGPYTIKASGCCTKCGELFAVTAPSRLVVEKQPISAAFTIRASATSPKAISGTVAQGRQVTLIGQASPDIARREWTCNGQIILGDDGKPKQDSSIEYRCTDVGEYVFGLTVYDDAGSAVGPEKHALKTYRLWAILLIAFVCLMIWGLLVWYWQGDDPRFWTILVRIDKDRDTSFKALKEQQRRPLKISVEDYWNMASNIAEISMRDLTRNSREAGDWKKSGLGDGKITIKAGKKNGKLIAVVEKLHGDFEVRPEDQTDPGSVFRVISESPEDPPVVLEIKRNIGDKTHVLYMALSFIGLSLAAVGLSAWLAF